MNSPFSKALHNLQQNPPSLKPAQEPSVDLATEQETSLPQPENDLSPLTKQRENGPPPIAVGEEPKAVDDAGEEIGGEVERDAANKSEVGEGEVGEGEVGEGEANGGADDGQMNDGRVNDGELINPTSIADIAASEFPDAGGCFDTAQDFSGVTFESDKTPRMPATVNDVTATATGAIIAKIMQRKLNSGQPESDEFAPRIQELPESAEDGSQGKDQLGGKKEVAVSTIVVETNIVQPAPKSTADDANLQPRTSRGKRVIVNEDELLRASRDRLVIVPRGNNLVIEKGSGFGQSEAAFAEAPPEAPVRHVTAMAVPALEAPVHHEIAPNPIKVPKPPSSSLHPVEDLENAFAAPQDQHIPLRSIEPSESTLEDQWNDREEVPAWEKEDFTTPPVTSDEVQTEHRPLGELDFKLDDVGFEVSVPEKQTDGGKQKTCPEPFSEEEFAAHYPELAHFAAGGVEQDETASSPSETSESNADSWLPDSPSDVATSPEPPLDEDEAGFGFRDNVDDSDWTLPHVADAQTRVSNRPAEPIPAIVDPTEFERQIARRLSDPIMHKEFELLATNLSARLDRALGTTIAISHIDEHDYAEQVITAVGTLLAQLGHRTLIVDADVEDGTLSRRLGHEASEGFGEACDRHQLWQHICKPTSIPGLSFLPAGTCVDDRFLEPTRLRRLFTDFSKGPYSAILLSVGQVSDGSPSALCEVSDISHVVVRLGCTERKLAQDLILNSGIRFHGCIVTNVATESLATSV